LLPALATALVLSLVLVAWAWSQRDYYSASQAQRPLMSEHEWLRPGGAFGLACGIGGSLLILANLAYLLRRNWLTGLPGSLTLWMTSHVATGVLALLLILAHAAMAPRNTVGGHALMALAALLVTGAIGRYFYAFVPRAANGRELALHELNQQLAEESADWDRFGRGFGEQARERIRFLVNSGKWKGGVLRRLLALLSTQSAAKEVVRQLRREGREHGLSDDQIERLSALARRAYATALASARYEDLRGLLNSWRYFHRWVAMLMVLLALAHIWIALQYGRLSP
jgi:hypothetical protein